MAQDIALTVTNGNEHTIVIDLQEKIKVLESKLKQKKKSNPAVVGLAGFGTTTLLLQFHNFDPELMTLTPIVWLGIVFGGAAQLVAGLQEYGSGNNFGYSAFSTYGAFWISLALFVLAHHTKTITMGKNDLGFFMIGFTLYTFIMLIGTLGLNCALFLTFFFLEIGFILLDIANFNKASEVGCKRAAGAFLFVCALGAWYVMAHVIYQDVFGKNILPVGPAPKDVLSRWFECRRQVKQNNNVSENHEKRILKNVFHLDHHEHHDDHLEDHH